MNINAEEQKGELSLNGLLEQTKPKEKAQHKKAEREILRSVFEWVAQIIKN